MHPVYNGPAGVICFKPHGACHREKPIVVQATKCVGALAVLASLVLGRMRMLVGHSLGH